MTAYRPYTGIGSRKLPPALSRVIAPVADTLARNGFTLRSGGARGADSAFEYYHRSADPARAHQPIQAPEIFRPDPPPPAWTFELVRKYVVDPGHRFDSFAPWKQALLARNMQQVLGRDGDSPTLFVLYWTEAETFDSAAAGGTRYALRCAEDHGVPLLNLGRHESTEPAEILGWCRKVVSRV